MAAVRLINKFGKMAGWVDLEIELFGRVLEGVLSIEYNDSQPTEWIYGGGDMPIGYGQENYTATASLELTSEEIRLILDSIPPGTKVAQIPKFPAKARYDYNGTIYEDVIRNCSLPGLGMALSQGDKMSKHKFDLQPSHIDWNGNKTEFKVPFP